MKLIFNNKMYLKILILALELSAFGLFLYLIVLPFYPKFKYIMSYDNPGIEADAQDVEKAKTVLAEFRNNFPSAQYDISPNRLIIKKIGVNAPIVETKNSDYGLSLGSWHVPESSTPDKGGNTVLTGHRFKYLPPNNLTFYLLDKLETGDILSVIWQDKDYFYRVKESKIVPATDFSIMSKSDEPILTLYTCDPIYSTKNRLVVIGELIK